MQGGPAGVEGGDVGVDLGRVAEDFREDVADAFDVAGLYMARRERMAKKMIGEGGGPTSSALNTSMAACVPDRAPSHSSARGSFPRT